QTCALPIFDALADLIPRRPPLPLLRHRVELGRDAVIERIPHPVHVLDADPRDLVGVQRPAIAAVVVLPKTVVPHPLYKRPRKEPLRLERRETVIELHLRVAEKRVQQRSHAGRRVVDLRRVTEPRHQLLTKTRKRPRSRIVLALTVIGRVARLGDDYLQQSLLADVVFGPYQRVEVVPMPMPSLPAFHGVFERQVNRTRGRVNSHERTARNEIRPPCISIEIKTKSEAGLIGAAIVKRENEVKRHIHAVDLPRLRVYRTVAVNIEA